MTRTREQQAIERVAARHFKAMSEVKNFVSDVQRGLDILRDAVDIATHRTSDDPETGEALADWNRDVAQAVHLIREFSAKIEQPLRRIR